MTRAGVGPSQEGSYCIACLSPLLMDPPDWQESSVSLMDTILLASLQTIPP